jgi:hydroxymethylpyrimidine kinase/phosphomethylpyrimidine kinase
MLCAALLPCAAVVTPNIPEAEALSGCRITSPDAARRAAERIHAMGAAFVVITGGHAGGPDVIDLAYDGRTFTEHRTPRMTGPPVHGTGCAFASALAACLALGHTPIDAAARAQQFVADALGRAAAIGRGARVLVY